MSAAAVALGPSESSSTSTSTSAVVPAQRAPAEPVRARLGPAGERDVGAGESSAPEEMAEPALLDCLVAEAVAGEPRAKDRLLTAIHPLVLRYCRGRLGRQETVIGSADDIAQEVCLAVVNALPGYTIRGLSFRAFVYGIAAHKVTDAFRAISRNRAEPMADLPDVPATHDGPEQRLLAAELTERLVGLLYHLTPRQREVLVLRIAVGMSAEETAHAVGSTPGAVRVTQHRALNRLRRVLAGLFAADGEEETDDE
jgi:RNA polymerase sigma-70 factor, ECF subfamily